MVNSKYGIVTIINGRKNRVTILVFIFKSGMEMKTINAIRRKIKKIVEPII